MEYSFQLLNRTQTDNPYFVWMVHNARKTVKKREKTEHNSLGTFALMRGSSWLLIGPGLGKNQRNSPACDVFQTHHRI